MQYTDVICGDEMISDAFKINLVDDVVYEVDAKVIRFSGPHSMPVS